MRIYQFGLFLLGAAVLSKVTSEQLALCLNVDGYSLTPKCESPLTIKLESITYAVNNESCSGGCCTEPNKILCEETGSLTQGVLESCDGKQTCTLESGTDIIAVDIKCPNYFESKKSAFAKIAFGCIIETTTLPSTTSVAATVSEKDSSKGTLPDRTSTTPSSPSNVEDSEAKNLGKTTNKSDIGMVIGLSVAGGILIIIIVVVIAVFTVRISQKQNASSQSQNSTKTLASSDIESSPAENTAQHTADVYGFEKPSASQQERLQRRNDNIKRNLSFKSEESKNKRPSKLSKSKHRSKSSSTDQLNSNNSNNKAESAVASKSDKDESTTPAQQSGEETNKSSDTPRTESNVKNEDEI